MTPASGRAAARRQLGRDPLERAARGDVGLPPPGFCLPPLTRVAVVRLQVRDLSRSVGYYEATLGLRVLSESGREVRLGAVPDELPLVVLREESRARPVPRRHLGLFHFAILLPDRSSLGRFVDHVLSLEAPVGFADHAVSEAVYLTDPDGLGIEVYADCPRHTWRYEGRQLYMTTEPLDVRDLIAAGAGEPWAGIPSGTVVGHVHLSVDDLKLASAFFHEGLGLTQTVWSYPGALFFSAGGYHHHLATNTWSAGAPLPRPDDVRLLEWELVLPDMKDVHQAAESLRSAGQKVREDGDEYLAADPWGTTVRLRCAGK